MTGRDLWMLGIGFGIGFFVFSTLGRRLALATMGLGKAEIERIIEKIEEKRKHE